MFFLESPNEVQVCGLGNTELCNLMETIIFNC